MQDFVVYAASSPEQLAAEYGRGQTIWCGLARALYGGQTCIAQISPFQDTVVTALRPGSGGAGTFTAFALFSTCCILQTRAVSRAPVSS